MSSKTSRDLQNGKETVDNEEKDGDGDDIIGTERSSLLDLYTKETQLVATSMGKSSDAEASEVDVDGGISMVIDREKKTKRKKGSSAAGAKKKQKV